jgi:hypothetical protein
VSDHICAEVARLRKAIEEARALVPLGPPADRGEGIAIIVKIDRLLLEALDYPSPT